MSEVSGPTGPGELSRIPFTAAAEGQIRSLAFWLTVVGWLNVAAAVGAIINLLTPQGNGGQVFSVIVHAAIAAWSLQAAAAFKAVATSDVADQAYLMQGFTKLRSIFLLQGVMILIVLAFIVAAVLFFALAPPGSAVNLNVPGPPAA